MNHYQLLIILVFDQYVWTNLSMMNNWPVINNTDIYLLGLFAFDNKDSERLSSSHQSRSMFQAAILLANQYNITIDNQPIGWLVASTSSRMIEAMSQACKHLSSFNYYGIVGPGLSREVHALSDFAQYVGIPIISHAATDPDLSNRDMYPALHRMIPSDETIGLAILHLFIRFNWNSCIIIHQTDTFGFNGMRSISRLFPVHGRKVEKVLEFDLNKGRLRENLKSELMHSKTRIVVIWAVQLVAEYILREGLNEGVVGPHFLWISTAHLKLSDFEDRFHSNLIGILTIEAVPGFAVGAPINQTLLDQALKLWRFYEPAAYFDSSNMSYFAMFSFDSTWSLIQSLSKYCASKRKNNESTTCLSMTNSSSCFHRRLLGSKELLREIDQTSFIGISGPVSFSSNTTDRVDGSYFSLFNVQVSRNGLRYVQVLEYSEETKWRESVTTASIIWPGERETIPTGRSSLENIRLVIGVFYLQPFTFIDSSNRTVGFMPDLIEKLRETLKFVDEIRVAPLNHTYPALLDDVSQGVYNIVVADITETALRRNMVDFSNSILDNSLRIAIRRSAHPAVDLSSFLKPFSKNLWLLVLATCIYASAVIFLLERNQNQMFMNRSIVSQILLSFWYVFGNMVSHGVDFHAITPAGRLMTTGLFVFSLILVASYTANLASNLTVLKANQFISSVEDLKNGRIPLNRIGIRPGSASEDYFLRELSRGNRNYHRLKSRQDSFESLVNGIIDATFIDNDIGEYFVNNIFCDLTLLDDHLERNSFGIVVPKGWIHSNDLDMAILSLRERGELEKLRIKWFQDRQCPQIPVRSYAIGIESIAGLFITFGAISLIAIFLFIWNQRQYFIDGCSRNQPEQTSNEDDFSEKKTDSFSSKRNFERF